MEVEVLTVPNCPNAAPMVAQVRQALDAVGLRDIEVTTRVIVDHEQAKRTAFTGSPTILIDGHDPLAEPGRSTGLACRVY
ncbi:hypothetical protein [Saccharopolyspora rectivirgula]|uniref:hypothetical protein n=1 Tax=Saccharopolyspora rectivirgula TaxID=28042 RepID=UPI0009DE10D2|nr:hypothetical protein [Saccharopolyspora rectivirgula]